MEKDSPGHLEIAVSRLADLRTVLLVCEEVLTPGPGRRSLAGANPCSSSSAGESATLGLQERSGSHSGGPPAASEQPPGGHAI